MQFKLFVPHEKRREMGLNMRKNLIVTIFTAVILILAPFSDYAESGEIVILHTNDVHATFENGLGYAGVSALEKDMNAEYGEENVVLVDAGDAIQGGPMGTLTKGEYVIALMNAVGYDIFAIGNHEFDYGILRLNELIEKLDAEVISSNFIKIDTGKPVFKNYVIEEYQGTKVAYIGIITPQSFTSSNPNNFRDKNGKDIYSFCEDSTGESLYKNVQTSIDDAIEEGADYIIAVAHLGMEKSAAPWRSTDVIKNTKGIDVMIDGHSHSVITSEGVLDKNNKTVILNQTGTKIENVGRIIIDPVKDTIDVALISKDYGNKDPEIQAVIDEMNITLKEKLNEVISKTDFALIIQHPETNTRVIRSQETNLGNLCADAIRSAFGADIALVNGGGVREGIPIGDITYGQIIDVYPFSSEVSSIKATGQQVLDALEMGAKNVPEEDGGFLHVSGLSYTIDTTIRSSVVVDGKGNFVKVNGEYRVKDVKIGDEDIDLNKTYIVAANNFSLLYGGNGMVMFEGAKIVKNSTMVDNVVLMQYIKGVVDKRYENAFGEKRINIRTGAKGDSL